MASAQEDMFPGGTTDNARPDSKCEVAEKSSLPTIPAVSIYISLMQRRETYWAVEEGCGCFKTTNEANCEKI